MVGRGEDYTLLLATFLLCALGAIALYLSLGHCLLSIGELGYVCPSVGVSVCELTCVCANAKACVYMSGCTCVCVWACDSSGTGGPGEPYSV